MIYDDCGWEWCDVGKEMLPIYLVFAYDKHENMNIISMANTHFLVARKRCIGRGLYNVIMDLGRGLDITKMMSMASLYSDQIY